MLTLIGVQFQYLSCLEHCAYLSHTLSVATPGKFLEASAKSKTNDVVRTLLQLAPRTATLVQLNDTGEWPWMQFP